MMLKLNGKLDYEVVHRILFREYRITVHQRLIVVTLLRLFRFDLYWHSSYSFHRIMLKLGGQLDHEMVQGSLFRGYSTPSFDRVITVY